MISFYDGIYEEDYEYINQTIIGDNLMNMSLVNMEVKYGAIDDNGSSCHGYYIINFFISIYPSRILGY